MLAWLGHHRYSHSGKIVALVPIVDLSRHLPVIVLTELAPGIFACWVLILGVAALAHVLDPAALELPTINIAYVYEIELIESFVVVSWVETSRLPDPAALSLRCTSYSLNKVSKRNKLGRENKSRWADIERERISI